MKNNKFGFFISSVIMLFLTVIICFFSIRYVEEETEMMAVSKGELRNTIEISLSEAKDISIVYTSDYIKLFPAEGNKVMIKEYLRRERGEEALASVSIAEGKATITGGERFRITLFPWIGVNERIEVYLPREGLENLELRVNSGNITAEEDFALQVQSMSGKAGSGNIMLQDIKAEQVNMEASSGNLRVDKLMADTLTLAVKSGNISGTELSGKVEFSAGSGNIRVTEFSGSGSMSTRSGGIDVEAREVTGDISLEAGSGNVNLAVSKDTSFTAEMNTQSGNIYTDFEKYMQYNEDRNHADGQIGETPIGKLSLKAGSGNVRLELCEEAAHVLF